MKKVRCLNNSAGAEALTMGKVYEAIEYSTNYNPRYYRLMDDSGCWGDWSKNRFVDADRAFCSPAINPEKLAVAIEKMTSVCAKGKDEIRAMLSEEFGVKIPEPKPKFKVQVTVPSQTFKMGFMYYSLNWHGDAQCVLSSVSDPGIRYIEGLQKDVVPRLQEMVDSGQLIPVIIDIKITEKNKG